ncbi:MAG TPA: hypothetical protein VGL81_32725 [Polyangiaceae bacterium]|jgi:hypothetical protein
MLRRALRCVLVSSLALVVWTFARPARAMPAPFCDDRGASGIAATPALEASDVAVQRARTTPPCPDEDLPIGVAVTRGRVPTAPPVLSTEPALPATVAFQVVPAGSMLDRSFAVESSRDGERSRIERPPRG